MFDDSTSTQAFKTSECLFNVIKTSSKLVISTSLSYSKLSKYTAANCVFPLKISSLGHVYGRSLYFIVNFCGLKM